MILANGCNITKSETFKGSEYFPYTLYIYIINIHSTHTYIMQTKTFILDAINHDYSFDSTNIYISVYVYQGRRFAFDIGGVTPPPPPPVIIYIAYFFIVCLTDSNYTIIIL